MNDIIVSSIVAQQLPDHVRGEYPNFVNFLQKYYEWMELNGNALQQSFELKTSYDVDLASNLYIEQMKKEFLPYFPEITTLDSRKFLKFSSQFYKSKGTPESLKFLFKALYNEEIDVFYPKDDILKASDGKWVLPLALRIDTNDVNILNIENCLLTGETSKATALVETVTRSVDRQLGISYIEVYVSNVRRLFETGEIVTATFNDGLNDITVSGKLIGALSQINIDRNNRGLFYNGFDTNLGYEGDPVTIVGGLNPTSNNPIGAIAYVGTTTLGSITDIVVTDGGYGFRNPDESNLDPNISLVDFKGGFEDALFGTEAKAQISLVDSNSPRTMNVSDTQLETIFFRTLDGVSPVSNSVNTQISVISSYQSFNVYPLSFILLTGSGGGYRNRPDVDVYSFYNEFNPDVLVSSGVNIVKGTSAITVFGEDLRLSFETGDIVRLFVNNRFDEIKIVSGVTANTLSFNETFPNDIEEVILYKVTRNDLRDIGSLGRIQIIDGGEDYAVGEYLIFTGGSGYGANARISELHTSNNGIKAVEFVQTNEYVIGGEGYRSNTLPQITVNTVAGSNASLIALEVSGDGEDLSLTTSRIGAISTLRIISYGYDYVSAPQISLRNADLTVTNATSGFVFVSNTKVYQGTTNTVPKFSAFVDMYEPETGLLRIYDYKGIFDETLKIKSDDGTIQADIVSDKFYGDGKAKATADFENGLIRYPGLYLNTDGHLSEDKYLQDSKKYHNFSYEINSNIDYEKFKETLQNIVHPAGTKVFVNKINENSDDITANVNNIIYKEYLLSDTFNISILTNRLVSTNTSANLSSYISVGDEIIVEDLFLKLQGTVGTTATSNTVIGTSTNFLNQIQDGDTVFISTGNTEIVTSVESNTSIITKNTIGVSSTGKEISLIYNDTKTVTFVNANTILVNSTFKSNGNNKTVLHRIVG